MTIGAKLWHCRHSLDERSITYALFGQQYNESRTLCPPYPAQVLRVHADFFAALFLARLETVSDFHSLLIHHSNHSTLAPYAFALRVDLNWPPSSDLIHNRALLQPLGFRHRTLVDAY